jgi:ADP-ribosylation factor-like protein 2
VLWALVTCNRRATFIQNGAPKNHTKNEARREGDALVDGVRFLRSACAALAAAVRHPIREICDCSGLDNAGKTTIVKRINNEDVTEVSPTLGFNIKSMEYLGFRLNIWDVGGQTTLRSYWKNYFEQTDGLIWVVDSSDRRRLAECATELHKLLMEERLTGASLLIFANKQDVAGALTTQQIADAMRLQYIGKRHWQIVACSATAGTGVSDGFDWIVKDIGNRVYMLA